MTDLHFAQPGPFGKCVTCRKNVVKVRYGFKNEFYTYFHESEIDEVADML